MKRTRTTQTSALTGFAPAGKPDHTNRARTGLLWLACALAATAMAPAQAQTETVLYNFGSSSPKGASPYAGVTRDSAGDLYGTTSSGGTAGAGVVYKVNPAGQVTVLYNFRGGTDGSFPQAGVIGDGAGNLYGVTESGGPANAGTVYKVNAAGQETVLYSFTGGADGDYPYAGSLIRDSAGNLYGTTLAGGSGVGFAGFGVVYKVDTSGHQSVLYTFTGGSDGGYPNAGVIRDSAGNLYGTASSGGDLSACGGYGCGVVFKLNPSGKETVMYTFMGGTDGAYPTAGVIGDSQGNLYGTASGGGSDLSACGGYGCGVVYKLDKSGSETALYSFTGGSDGADAYAGVVRDEAGNLYGTTLSGGDLSACNGSGCGVVYKVDTSGNETVLHTFTGGTDGSSPYAGVIRDEAGNLYGTTNSGGAVNMGAVYKLDTSGNETLYAFTSSPNGTNPSYSGVIPGEDGRFYGTTDFGGTANAGVVYELNPDGGEAVLHTFTGGADGGFPAAGLIRDWAGNLYGTTNGGGTSNAGVVYKVDRAGHETVLYSFTGGNDGSGPIGSLAVDLAGNLYGTTGGGGTSNHGVVFKVDPAGHETVLYSFTGGTDGSLPAGGVIRDFAGNLYGTTIFGGSACCAGVVFKVDPSGNETVLHSFACGPDGCGTCPEGCQPHAGLTFDPAGSLYGTTFFGGPVDGGIVFKVDPSGNETLLYAFAGGYQVAGGADGGNPYAGVTRDLAGNLYGTTSGGGPSNVGVVYKLDPANNETVLYSFTGGADGSQPFSGVIRDPFGNLYGTTSGGGANSGGVVFKLKPQ